MSVETQSIRYPRFSRRVAAVVVDSMIYMVLFIALAVALGRVDMHGGIKVAVMVAVYIILEPVLVSITGGTLGQHWRGLRVQHAETGGFLSLPRAVLRFIVKSILGLYSLLLILLTKRHQAVHDMVSGSVVVLRDPDTFEQADALEERDTHEHGYDYPSVLARLACIIAYQLAWLVIVAIMLYAVLTESCLFYENCSQVDNTANLVVSLIWFAVFGAIIVFGWRGRLWGARRKPL